jgi:hypothetical protein
MPNVYGGEAIFRRVVLLVDQSSPMESAFAQVLYWAKRSQLPARLALAAKATRGEQRPGQVPPLIRGGEDPEVALVRKAQWSVHPRWSNWLSFSWTCLRRKLDGAVRPLRCGDHGNR